MRSQHDRAGQRVTDSHHDQPIAPNRLPDLPAPSAPNQVWLGGITYVTTVPILVECSS